MKHLIVARHGSYESHDHMQEQLTSYGLAQYGALVDLIRPKIIRPVGIISSPYPRAMASAQVFGNAFDVPNIEQEFAFAECNDGSDRNELERDLRGMFDVVMARGYESLIVVTHLEHVKFFPPYFLQRMTNCQVKPHHPKRGEAIHIDIEQKTATLLTSQHVSTF